MIHSEISVIFSLLIIHNAPNVDSIEWNFILIWIMEKIKGREFIFK